MLPDTLWYTVQPIYESCPAQDVSSEELGNTRLDSNVSSHVRISRLCTLQYQGMPVTLWGVLCTAIQLFKYDIMRVNKYANLCLGRQALEFSALPVHLAQRLAQ